MTSAVLDTNTLVSGLGWPGSIPAKVIDHGLKGKFVMVTSPALLDELARVLLYPKLAEAFNDPHDLIALIAEASLVVEPTTKLHVIAEDEQDNRVIEAARAGSADYIVTGDNHLLKLDTFESTQIVPPKAFLKILER